VSVRIIWVEREGAVKQVQCLSVVRPIRTVVQHLGGEHALISRHAVGRLAVRTVVCGGLDAAGERRGNRAGHLVLNGEDILKLAVVAFSPNVSVGFSIDQLHCDPDAIASLSYASLENIIDAKFARDLLHLHRFALIHEGRISRDNEQASEAG
jgi:hypothetical protein